MTNLVNDGLDLMHTAGQKVQQGVNAVHKRDKSSSGWPRPVVEVVASAAGALAAFFVSRLIRSRLGRHEG
jgi:hypothetical protein